MMIRRQLVSKPFASTIKSALLVLLTSAMGQSFAASFVAPATVLGKSEIKQLTKLKPGAHAKLRKGLEFKLLNTEKDAQGHSHSRLQQHFDGVPVFGGDVTLHVYSGGRTRLGGTVVEGLENELPYPLPEKFGKQSDSAIALAEKLMEDRGGASSITTTHGKQHAAPIIYVEKGRANLAFQVQLKERNDKRGFHIPNVIVNPDSGKALHERSGVVHIKKGTGPGGNQKTGLKEYGTGGLDFLDITEIPSEMRCILENADYRTYDAEGTNGVLRPNKAAISYPCSPAIGYRNTLRPISGGFSPANDAHYLVGKTIEMYQQLLGTKPFSKKIPIASYSTVDFNLGCGAAWATDMQVMLVGYGDFRESGPQECPFSGLKRYPYAVPDIIAHELTHAYISETAKFGEDGIGGALAEAFGDIAGVSLEIFLNGQTDWAVGTDVIKDASPALRYIDQPSRDGSPEHVNQYNASLGVHKNAGIFNRAFYLLANKPGWNAHKVFQVLGRASKWEWTTGVNFDSATCGVLESANDMQLNVGDVVQAFGTTGLVCSSPPVVTNHLVGGNVMSSATALKVNIANAVVTLTGSRGTFTAMTDNNGFYVKALPWGTYTITAAKVGYTFNTPVQVSVSQSTTSGTVVSPLWGSSSLVIAGRLRDSTQSTIDMPGYFAAGKVVGLFNGATRVSQRLTESDGEYEFTNLTPNTTYTVKVTEPGWIPAAKEVALTTTSQFAHLVTAPVAGTVTVSGYVRNSNQSPQVGFRVQLTPCDDFIVYTTQTNENGYYNFWFPAGNPALATSTCPAAHATVSTNNSSQLVPNGSTSVILIEQDRL